MTRTPYRGFRFPKLIIQHTVWLYARFTLSLRDVEELLAQRGTSVSYETISVWVRRFGPLIARRLRRQRGLPSRHWHLDDEMFVKICGRQMYLWRAVDAEGEILDVLVQSKRDKRAALRLMRKLLKKQGMAPAKLITDRLSAYRAAARELGLSAEHVQGKRKNNRAESSHVPIRRRDRKMQGFRSAGCPTLPRHPCCRRQYLHHLPLKDIYRVLVLDGVVLKRKNRRQRAGAARAGRPRPAPRW
jgi:putative transposase